MKRLIILRHGKSSWKDEGSSDFDRPLDKRGEKSSTLIGEFIDAKHGKPDLIITSSANRAYDTAKIVAEVMEYPVEDIKASKELYLAWINELLSVIESIPQNVKSCLLVGHNPGLTELINYFGVRLDNLPTASVACFEFTTNRWNQITSENAELKWLQLARDL